MSPTPYEPPGAPPPDPPAAPESRATTPALAPELEAVTPAGFRTALSRFASGVTVVGMSVGPQLGSGISVGQTALTVTPRRFGVTVSAFASVSLRPPLVLICLDGDATARDVVEEAGGFTISLLSDHHEFLAERFAGRAPMVLPDWPDVPHTLSPTGHPIITGCLAWLDCRVAAMYEAGDHVVVVAEALGGSVGDDDRPLLYWAGRYRELA